MSRFGLESCSPRASSHARLTSIDYALDIDELYDLAGLP
jgi:hypothetical protein